MSLSFAIMVAGHPYRDQAPSTALNVAMALRQRGNALHSVFFFHDGVHCGNANLLPPQSQKPFHEAWQILATESGSELIICSTSALRRGVLSASEARRHNLPEGSENLAPGFGLGGLGQWVAATQNADRVLRFGGTQ